MAGRVRIKARAVADQLVAVLRAADGFPISTADAAHALGERFVLPRSWIVEYRPSCWPADYVEEAPKDGWFDDDDEDRRRRGARCWAMQESFCDRCRGFHREPVWQRYEADNVRGALNRLAAEGEIEKVVVDGTAHHFWRASTEAG